MKHIWLLISASLFGACSNSSESDNPISNNVEEVIVSKVEGVLEPVLDSVVLETKTKSPSMEKEKLKLKILSEAAFISEEELELFLTGDEEQGYRNAWKTDSKDFELDMPIMYGFMTDGRLHVQGPDGEATMWSGKWYINADGLNIQYEYVSPIGEVKDINFTVVAKTTDQYLILDNSVYEQ